MKKRLTPNNRAAARDPDREFKGSGSTSHA
jgi:hypothetical protein